MKSLGVVIFGIFVIVKDTSCQLENACKHNQFRCSEGARCLSTEKLCNGKKECPRGEDERGSAQWDCSKVTLSTSCNAVTEYKCRYGGCIPKDKLCDGTPDCWGANDEATDVCRGKRPSSTQSKPPPPNSNPPAVSRPSPQAPPPRLTSRPTRPVQSNNPKPPPPPQQGSGGCPPLSGDDLLGYSISCVDAYNRPFDCIKGSSPPGSKARYKCKQYYTAPGIGGTQTERNCQDNAQWTSKRSSFTCTLGCGDGGAENVALITGGIQSKRGKWPWHTALYQEDPPNSGKYDFFCGGSLLNSKAILTAAHCVTKKFTSEARDPREIRVVLGKYRRSYDSRDGDEQERNVREINVNEGYDHYNLENDIAVIWLDKPVVIGDFVRPVCLPTVDDNDVYATSNHGRLIGWGRTSSGKITQELQEARIPVISPQTCKESDQAFRNLVRGTTFCAGYRNGTSACDGDSGGGLMFPDIDGGRVWRVQGIVSAGIAKRTGGTGGCQENHYAVFTKVGRYLPWIFSKLDQDYRK